MIDRGAANRVRGGEQAEALDRAVTFLLQARRREAWWLDFQLAPGPSDEWVTAYVGTTLAYCSEVGAREAARTAWDQLMLRERPSGTWGYNSVTPGDADSTCWGIQLAQAVGEGKSDRAQRARRALKRHLREDCGITTYANPEPIRAFTRSSADRSFQGWCGSQPCVTAAVAALSDMAADIRPYILRTQRADGSWRSYWWCDDAYATALAAEALVRSGRPEDEPRVRRAARWAAEQIDEQGRVITRYQPDGSPFATAWCLRTLLLDDDEVVVRCRSSVISWLIGQQRADGSWAPSAYLRVPFPEDVSPWERTDWVVGGKIEGSVVLDQYRNFTTATVLNALCLAGWGTGSRSESPFAFGALHYPVDAGVWTSPK